MNLTSSAFRSFIRNFHVTGSLMITGFLFSSASSLADIQLTSFESGLSPWTATTTIGSGTTTSSIVTSSFTDGAASDQVVFSPTTNPYATVISVNVSNYTTIFQSGTTAIKADVYFQWDNKPTSSSGGVYYSLPLNLNNSSSGFTTITATSGALTENAWSTITWNLTPSQITTITSSGLTYNTLGFLLNAGTYGTGAVMGGTITMRFDNIIAVGASAIPEPSTYAAILGGLALTGVMIRRRYRRA